MPKVTIWIREGEDFDIWQQIKDRPKFLHNVLQLAKKQLNNKKKEES